MKILFQHDGFEGNGNFPERVGIINVLRALGHVVIDWDFKAINAFDMFTRAEQDGKAVDLFIGQTYNATPAVCKNIASRPSMKILLQCSTWGDILKDVDLAKYPILVPTEDEKRAIGGLAANRNDIIVYQNYATDRVADCLNGWSTLGVKPVSNLNAADLFVFYKGKFTKEFASDLCYIGGRWGYKGQNIDRYILPLCNERTGVIKSDNTKASIKIFGGAGWQGVGQYLGMAKDNDIKDIFASSKICLNVHEPHSTVFGFDIVARPFKIISSGGFCISDYVDSLAKHVFYQNEIPFYSNLQELKDLINFYLTNEDKRFEHMKLATQTVLAKHTYFHRVSELFKYLNLNQESLDVIKYYENFISH